MEPVTQAPLGHELLLSIAGGAALLLWAVRMVRTGMLRAFGSSVRALLRRAAGNRLSAFGIGTVLAGGLQSSTATALLTVPFAERGVIGTVAGIAILLGADLGSTLVVQVVSFDIGAIAPVLLLVGVVAFMTSGASKGRQLGRIAIGLGLILLSLELIVAASAPLRDSETFHAVLQPLAADPALAFVLAAAIAWLSHSSVATVLLVVTLVEAGAVPLPLGLVLVLGANAGAGLIPFVLTLRSGRVARRIPLGNLLIRVGGAIAALIALDAVMPWLAMLEADPTRQIANLHTGLNLVLGLVMLPLLDLVAFLVRRILPDQPAAGDGDAGPRYLDESAIETPAVALGCATRELLRMAEIAESMFRDSLRVLRDDDPRLLKEIELRDDVIDRLHEDVTLYLTKVSRNVLDEKDSRRCVELITAAVNLEHVGDIIERGLMNVARKKIKNKLRFSREGWKELEQVHALVLQNMQLSVSVFASRDRAAARHVVEQKDQLRQLEREAGEQHLDRMREGTIESLDTHALHFDVLRDLKRINSHMAALAYPTLEAAGEMRETRLTERRWPV